VLRLGLIGTDGGAEGGHALQVCKLFNHDQICDGRFVGVYGEDRDETLGLASVGGIDFVAEDPLDLLDRVDAVFVMFRDGCKHLPYAMPFLERGIPVFVDKPFTITVEDAETMIALAKKSGSILCGGSTLKYMKTVQKAKQTVQSATKIFSGQINYPCNDWNSPHRGIHFHSAHPIETMIEIFGSDILAVNATLAGERVVVIASYEKYPVILNFACHQGNMNVGAYLQGFDYFQEKLESEEKSQMLQCLDFINSIKTGICGNLENLLTAVKVSWALEKSILEGRPIKLK